METELEKIIKEVASKVNADEDEIRAWLMWTADDVNSLTLADVEMIVNTWKGIEAEYEQDYSGCPRNA